MTYLMLADECFLSMRCIRAAAVALLDGAKIGDDLEASKLNLEEAVSKANEMSDDGAIVAKPPFTWGSEAMIVESTDECRVPEPVKNAGYEYVIEHEELLHLLAYLKKKKISSRATAEFVIHYAITDSSPAWINDIPDV